MNKRKKHGGAAEVDPLTPVEIPGIRKISSSPVRVFISQPVSKTQSLPPPASRSSNRKTIFDFKKRKIRTDQPWINKNIEYKICTTFVENTKKTKEDGSYAECHCGAEKSEHARGYTEQDPDTTSWDKAEHTRKARGFYFGKINFSEEDGTHRPDFVRISEDYLDTERYERRVMELLISKWKLARPNLLISVTGGAQDFACPPELEKRFKRGLAKAAKSTDAWIFTGGTNTGVMKLVGEAVRGTSFGSQIITIGVATWGIIKNREQLGSPSAPNTGKLVSEYETKVDKKEKRGAFLDPNHTHFLLVDDGTQYQYGVEIDLRSKLEQKISEKFSEGGCTLPQICILIEGGPNSIKTLLSTIRLGNPGLVIAGSGRSADVLAEAHKLSRPEEAFDSNGERITVRTLSEANKEELYCIIGKKFPNSKNQQKEEIFDWTLELLRNDKLLTIYELNDSKEFDLALLSALIRGNMDGTSNLASMRLAITWDRPALADTLILPTSKFTEPEKADLLKISIKQDKPIFIEMMLDQGVDMKYFLTEERLCQMYKEIEKTVICYKKLKKIGAYSDNKFSPSLTHIGMLMEEILEGTYQSEFTAESYVMNGEKNFDNPYDMMVVYAVLNESQQMAKLFWKRCKTPIATGLIAYKINKYLSEVQRARLNRDEENEKILLEWAYEFERLSVGVMHQCYKDRNHQKDLWTEVMTMKHKTWGNLNLIDLAYTTGAQQFTAQGAVQTWLSDIWLGQIHAAQNSFKITLAVLLPVVGPLFLIRYTKRDKEEPDSSLKVSDLVLANHVDPVKNGEQGRKKGSNEYELTPVVPQGDLENPEDHTETDGELTHCDTCSSKRKLTYPESFMSFYNAPIVKFNIYLVVYLAFLVTYIYTLVRGPAPEARIAGTRYTAAEIFLLLYVLSTIPIEALQIVDQIPATFHAKFLAYVRDFFNILDVSGILCFLTGFILKSFGDEHEAIPVSGPFKLYNVYHLLLILSFMFYMIRLMQPFRIVSQIGPKIEMISRMLVDLFFFIFLMLIFLLAYGVCAQSLMQPNKNKRGALIFWEIVMRPYYHVFGELDIDGMNEEIIEGHCTEADIDTGDCTIDTVMFDDTGAVHYYLVMGLLFVYLLFVNILLLNLLIAIFSKTYEDIQAESNTLWKVQRFGMITEYKNFSCVPQPFSILVHSAKFVKFIVKRCMKCCQEKKDKEALDEGAVYRVSMIEAESREEFQSKREEEEEVSPNTAFRELQRQLDLLKAMIGSGTISTATPAPGGAPASEAPSNALTRIKPLKVHIDSRTSPYPGSTIQRFKVPDDKVSWSVRYPDYVPVTYTTPEIANQTSDHIDPAHITLSAKITFNKIQRSKVNKKDWTIDRTSHHGRYNVIDGLPQNPKGRTGIVGRGSLMRWGPNHAADTVVTRWHRDANNTVVKIDDKPILEFVAILRAADNQWAIPGGRVKPNERVFDAIKREFSEDALANLARSDSEQAKISEMLREHFNLGITVYKGYIDDPRNTDNAWIESIAVNYHDSTGTSFSHFPLKAVGSSLGVQWIPIDHNMDLYANHEWIIEKVCYHRDAYNPIKEPKRKDGELWLTSLT